MSRPTESHSSEPGQIPIAETLNLAETPGETLATRLQLEPKAFWDGCRKIDGLYRDNRFLDALSVGGQLWGKDVRQWPDVEGKILAAKLADRLGGDQLSRVLIYGLSRRHGDHAEVVFLNTRDQLSRKPLARLWLTIRDQELPTEDKLLRSRWLGLKASILIAMRDFDRGFALIDESLKIAPDFPGNHVARARALANFDDVPGAIGACRDALELSPGNVPAIQHLTHYLLQSGAVDEAFDVLGRVAETTQSGSVRMQLAMMLSQRQDYAVASELITEIEKYFPLADPMRNRLPKPDSVYSSIASIRSDLAYHAGDKNGCVRWARLANDKFHTRLADRIEPMTEKGKRVQLEVPFVLQKHVTCAPATLTMLSRFWNIHVEMDTVVDEICYDGTAPVKQRAWAEANGMIAREFRVTQQAVKDLIDAGIPFGLSTIDPGNGHIQVVCGYDENRGVLLIQDPGAWYVSEATFERMLDRYAAFGPRGLVLVPKEQQPLLDAVELPEASKFDGQHAIATALEKHDRAAAEQVVQKMTGEDPDDWMTLWAQIDLARYDNNSPMQLETVRKLRALFPDNPVLSGWETSLLSMLDRPNQVMQQLRESIAGGDAGVDERLRLIDLLEDEADAEERDELLRWVLRRAPMSSSALTTEAQRLWTLKQRENALELFRLAAMASEMDEGFSRNYLMAATQMERQDEVLEVLRKRFENHGNSSGQPGMTFAHALDEALRPKEAIQVVRKTLSLRPDDGELICEASHLLGRLEDPRAGLELLESAKVTLPATQSWRAKAILASYDGRPGDSLAALCEVEKLTPLNPGVISQIARLKTELNGIDSAIDYLVALTEKFPNCRSILSITAETMHDAAKFVDAVGYIDRMLVSYYSDAWAWRERSLLDTRCGWHDQALEDAEQALRCDRSALSYTLRGNAFVKLDRLGDAVEDFRCALEDDCDCAWAISSWMMVCEDEYRRRDALQFIFEQLIEQRTNGNGLSEYYRQAAGILDQDTLCEQLKSICDGRPDNYTAQVLLSKHYGYFGNHEESERVLLRIEERYETLPSFWQQFGDHYAQRDETEKAIAAYEKGIKLSPHDSALARSLAAVYRSAERPKDAAEVLQRALKGSPGDPSLMVALAQSIDDKPRALQLVRDAAMRAPTSSDAWGLLLGFCRNSGKEPEAVEAARELVAKRPHDPHAHLRLAEMLHREDQWEESLNVIADAMALDRRLVDTHGLFAQRLMERNYYEKALEACAPPEVDPQDLHSLTIFSAGLLYSNGEKQAACDRLRDGLRRDPTDLTSWARLADWAEELSDDGLYDQCSNALIERASHLAMSHGYYATSLLRHNHRDKAKEHLRHAVDLEPEYAFATQELIRLHIADKDVRKAEQFLDDVAEKLPVELCVMGRLMIAAARGDAKSFVQTLQNLPDDVNEVAVADIACGGLTLGDDPEIALELSKKVRKRKASQAVGHAWALFFCHPDFIEGTLRDFHRMWSSPARNAAGAVLMSVFKSIYEVNDTGLKAYAIKETNRVLKRLASNVYKNPSLWCHAMWTLLAQDQNKKASQIARQYKRVKDRDVDDLVPAMLAGLYARDLKLVAALVKDANTMDASKMTAHGQLLQAMYTVHVGTDQELERTIRKADKNELSGPFLRIAKLITTGVEGIESTDETKLLDFWSEEYVKQDDYDPIDKRILLTLLSRIATAAGDKKAAKKYKADIKKVR